MSHDIKLYATRVDSVDQTLCRQLYPYLSQETQDKLQKFRLIDDRIRSLFGEILIRNFAVEHWNIPNERIKFVRNKYGKPTLLGYPDYHFNVAHSGRWVVAVFDTSPVGIDIEQIRPIDLTIADRFFTEIETMHLYEQPSEERFTYFYKLWTLKESYIKAVGRGLSIPLNSFSFVFTDGEIKFDSDSELDTWNFQQYEVDSDYKLAVCGNSNNFPEKLEISPWPELVNRFERLASER